MSYKTRKPNSILKTLNICHKVVEKMIKDIYEVPSLSKFKESIDGIIDSVDKW